MTRNYLGAIFTPAIRAAHLHYYGKPRNEQDDGRRDSLTSAEIEFIAARDSFYMATVTETGWPYLQHRGGPPGFLRVLDGQTLAFADYKGNRQLISTGNLAANDRVSLFLMDYPQRERLKILGHARVEDARTHPEQSALLATSHDRHLVERIFFIAVQSFDWNCSQHITPRYTSPQLDTLLTSLKTRAAEYEPALTDRPSPEADNDPISSAPA